ncbi:MAG: hypothetical protein ACKO34_07700, partial [Vampirovibrionales bacterium]
MNQDAANVPHGPVSCGPTAIMNSLLPFLNTAGFKFDGISLSALDLLKIVQKECKLISKEMSVQTGEKVGVPSPNIGIVYSRLRQQWCNDPHANYEMKRLPLHVNNNDEGLGKVYQTYSWKELTEYLTNNSKYSPRAGTVMHVRWKGLAT